MIDSYEWENAGILGCRHFPFAFSVLGFRHAVPEMIGLWKIYKKYKNFRKTLEKNTHNPIMEVG